VSKDAVDVVSKLKDTKLRKQYNASIEVIKALSTVTGANFNIVSAQSDESGRYISPKGVYDPNTNTFTLDILSGMNNIGEVTYSAMVKTAGHELTHYIQRWDAEKYAILKKLTLDFIAKEHGRNWIDAQLEKIKESNSALGKNLSTEQAEDELVADAFEDVLSEIDFAETVHKTDKRLFAKIQEWFNKLLERFKKALKTATEGVEAQSSTAATLREAGDDAMHLFNSWSDAFASALENSTVETKTQVEDKKTRFSSRNTGDSVQNGIDGYSEKEYNDYGWARANDVLSATENADLRSKFANAVSKQTKPPKTKAGEFMISIGDKVENKIAYMKGTIDNPIITRIVEIDEYDETNLAEIRRHLYETERRGIEQKTRGIFRRYDLSDFGMYEPSKRGVSEMPRHNNKLRTKRGRGSQNAQGITGIRVNDNGTYTTVYSDGTEKVTHYKFSTRDIYDVLDIETRADLAEHILTYIEDEGGYRAQLKQSISSGELNKIKMTAQAYKEAVKVYQDAYRDLNDAITSGNSEAITLAYSTLALRERALLDIEMSRELRDVIYGLGKNVGKSAKSRRKYTNRDFDINKEAWKGTGVTPGDAAQSLMSAFGITGDGKTLTAMLNTFYGEISTKQQVTWEDIQRAARPSVEWISKHIDFADSDITAEVDEILDRVKEYAVFLTETQISEIKYKYGNIAEFRKQARGKIKLSQKSNMFIEDLYRELSADYPATFDSNVKTDEIPEKLLG
ncbi:MAG: hypothetical protein IJC20_04155, partial [Clostridia bacterium]|nr:hypothetical protein [Clostridia bacterium]